MAATDALPVPRKNAAYRITFPIYKNDGTLITGAAGLDSEVSKDGAAFADCTNEATEIGTSGIYTLDLTLTEMNADTVSVKVGTSSTGAVIPTFILYPEEAGDIRVNVTAFGGTAGTFASGRPEVNLTHIAGSAVSTSTAQLGVNVVNFGGNAGSFASGIPNVALTTSSRDGVADAVWDEATSGHVAAGSFGAATQPLHGGTMQSGSTSTTAVLASGASSSNDYYNNALLVIVSGTGAGQSQYISDYVGSTRTATMNGTWITTPDTTSVYAVLPGGTIPGASAPTAADNAAAVWNAARSSYTAAGSFGQSVGGEVTRSGTAQAGTTTSITLDASASATNSIYKYHSVEIVSGTGAGQVSYITGYTGSSKVATVDPAFTTAPDATSVFILRKTGLDAATPGTVADAVWDEPRSGHAVAGTFGEYVLADATRISGDATAADNCEAFFDGTGYAGTNNVIPTVTTITNTVNANVTQISGDSVAADNLEAAADGTGYNLGGGSIVAASVTGAVGSVTGNVGGNVVGSVASVTGAVGSVTGNVGGNVVGSVASVTATVSANVVSISGDTVAADNLESYCDGTDRIPVDVREINSVVVTGTGTTGNEWGP